MSKNNEMLDKMMDFVNEREGKKDIIQQELITSIKDITTAIKALESVRGDYKKPEKLSWEDIFKENLKHNIFKIIIGFGLIVVIILVIFNENLVIKIGGFEAKSCKQQNLKL